MANRLLSNCEAGTSKQPIQQVKSDVKIGILTMIELCNGETTDSAAMVAVILTEMKFEATCIQAKDSNTWLDAKFSQYDERFALIGQDLPY